jgi:hypothetical protein
MFQIIITEIPDPAAAKNQNPESLPLGTIQRYSQTVDNLDVQGIIRMINTTQRKQRESKKKT